VEIWLLAPEIALIAICDRTEAADRRGARSALFLVRLRTNHIGSSTKLQY
jgi:hypothetical protein